MKIVEVTDRTDRSCRIIVEADTYDEAAGAEASKLASNKAAELLGRSGQTSTTGPYAVCRSGRLPDLKMTQEELKQDPIVSFRKEFRCLQI